MGIFRKEMERLNTVLVNMILRRFLKSNLPCVSYQSARILSLCTGDIVILKAGAN